MNYHNKFKLVPVFTSSDSSEPLRTTDFKLTVDSVERCNISFYDICTARLTFDLCYRWYDVVDGEIQDRRFSEMCSC